MRTLIVVVLRSLSWRRWATAGLVAASVAAFAAAAVGPLGANAAEDSMLAQTLRAQGRADGSSLVQVTARGNDSGYGCDRLVDRFSGGQQQRVAVAGALVRRPRLLVADEPTSELDEATRDHVLAELRAEARHGAVVVIASHDPAVLDTCDRVVELVPAR